MTPDQPSETPAAGGAHAVVCTLAEGTYFCGVAALANSLVKAGFRGDIVVGYRGAPPSWLGDLRPDDASGGYLVAEGVRLRLVAMGGTWHINNLKPRLIAEIFGTTGAELVYYFDTDVFITGAWETIAGWTRHGVVLVQDVSNSDMPPQHVYRRAWERLALGRGYPVRAVTGYVNGGCIGLSRGNAAFADVWADLMTALEEEGMDMSRIRYEGGRLEFAAMDQDVLNAATMASDIPVALLGCEVMGVYPRRGVVMPHAMFGKKPWIRPYIVDALRGLPPGRVHLAFWNFVDGPIRPFARLALARKRMAVRIAQAIGLLHVRVSREL